MRVETNKGSSGRTTLLPSPNGSGESSKSSTWRNGSPFASSDRSAFCSVLRSVRMSNESVDLNGAFIPSFANTIEPGSATSSSESELSLEELSSSVLLREKKDDRRTPKLRRDDFLPPAVAEDSSASESSASDWDMRSASTAGEGSRFEKRPANGEVDRARDRVFLDSSSSLSLLPLCRLKLDDRWRLLPKKVDFSLVRSSRSLLSSFILDFSRVRVRPENMLPIDFLVRA